MDVRDAVAAAPREWFLPAAARGRAAYDGPIPIGHGQTNSQPRTVVAMLGLLDVRPGHRVLDVGAGSGWTTALLAELVGPTGEVLGLELEPDLVAFGRANLARGSWPWARIEAARADALGDPDSPAYDRILVSAEARTLPGALLDQLASSGRLVVPVAGEMLLVEATPGDPVVTRHGRYRFVPLRRSPDRTRHVHRTFAVRLYPAGVSERGTTEDPQELVRLASADNFRDVAGVGAGYPTVDGRRVRRGVFYRSNELQLTHADAAELGALGVAVVHDLRSAMEVEAHPDVEVPGATWRHVEVSGIPMEMVSGLEDADAAHRVMREVYDAFVRTPAARASYAALLTDLATGPTPQLFHCTAGKDRTGWAAALLLELAGVDRATIMADYLLTNTVSSATREKYLALIAEHLGEEKKSVYEPTMLVEESFLETAYAAADEVFGGVEGYLRDGLGLDDTVVAALRDRLVG